MTDAVTLYHFTSIFTSEKIEVDGVIKVSTCGELESDESATALAESPEFWQPDAIERLLREGVDLGPLAVHLTSDPRPRVHPFPAFHRRVRFAVRVPRSEAQRFKPWALAHGLDQRPEDRTLGLKLSNAQDPAGGWADWYVVERDIRRDEWTAVEVLPAEPSPIGIIFDKLTAEHRKALSMGEGFDKELAADLAACFRGWRSGTSWRKWRMRASWLMSRTAVRVAFCCHLGRSTWRTPSRTTGSSRTLRWSARSRRRWPDSTATVTPSWCAVSSGSTAPAW